MYLVTTFVAREAEAKDDCAWHMDIALQKSGSLPVDEWISCRQWLERRWQKEEKTALDVACDGGNATVLLNQYLSMGRGNTRPTYDVVMVATKKAESGEEDAPASSFHE